MPASTAADFVREYLIRMVDIRGTGGATKETSYYSALENLLNHFGEQLKPKVICNGQLRNDGAGNPDFGLYSRSQIQKGEPRKGQKPERGVIEVKGLAEHTWQTADSAQATKYFDHYRLVLITNYREFRLIGEDASGNATELDKYTLAVDEAAFWAMAEAAGVPKKEILDAKRSALSSGRSRGGHCALIRKAIPWSVIKERLQGI